MEDKNSNVITNKTAPPLEKTEDISNNKDECTSYGWGKIRPKYLKFLSSPVWFVAVFSVFSLFQGIASWGFPNLVLPSIERRFAFSAKELGVIAAANDISALLIVVFISYYGDYGNKIKWMSGGALVTGLGVIIFALPHFMIGRYHPGSSHLQGLCSHGNGTMAPCVSENSGGDWYYLAVFIIAMLTMGAGSAPYFSLFNAYLDENVEPKSFPLFLGICNIIQFLSPGLGFIIGGKFLSIYVDIEQPVGFSLTPRDPRWIGAWWIGFLLFGSLIILFSVILSGFPREMPGARERRQNHIREGNIKPSNDSKQPSLRKIPSELKALLKNSTYVFNTLGLTCLLFYAATIGTFFSKILRVKFGLDGVSVGYVLATISFTGVVIGVASGSIIVRLFSLKTTCKKAAAATAICNLLAIGGTLIYLIPACENANIAGVALQYHSPSMNQSSNFGLLKSQCNKNCGCSLKSFSPVCGSDNLTYFDSCHAGCTQRHRNKTFTNCSCIPGKARNKRGSATLGYCDRDCKNLVIFSLFAVISSAIRFTALVPTRTVTLRCVPDDKRAFASGVTYVIYKTFGLLPSPIIFGHIVDESCRLWQNICGRKGRCFDYDIVSLSRNIALFGVVISVCTTICYFLSWYFCKTIPETKEEIAGLENEGADQLAADETPL
ncbi:solute carrier organic anion transporter family member 4C1-like [Dendronephthya gigantea]|uniref:solute carrier organic anion transporter family member 4C1-like n=1 Tax=Dendronephthya gigantea TaxID=151771 RepID=UPI00106ABB4E|nr:solute carrier organic anion transporter family member 4C1-like [Dendronephthya gigantea]